MQKYTIDEKIDFYVKTINLAEDTKVKVGLTPLDVDKKAFKDDNNLDKTKKDVATVKKDEDTFIAEYPFIIKKLAEDLNIKIEEIFYVKGWIDADGSGDEEITMNCEEEVVLEVVCECNEEKNYRYEVDKDTFVCFSKDKLDWLMKHEGYKENPYIPKDKFGNTIGDSGITLGYGYDLGQQTITSAQNNLNKYYSTNDVEKLLQVVGKTKQEAVSALNNVKSILISKDGAKEMLIDILPIHVKRAYKIYPEMIKLCPYSQVALISLIYNRGNSLNGERRKEIKNIQVHLKNGEYEKIYDEFINMKRIWEDEEGAKGLLIRREEEADLFMKGLKRMTNE